MAKKPKGNFMAASVNTSSDDTTGDDPQQDAVAPTVRLSSVTYAAGFSQAVVFLRDAAANATDLASFKLYLSDLASDTTALVGAINSADQAVADRLRAGVPPPRNNLPPPPPPAPPPEPVTNDVKDPQPSEVQ